VTFEVLPAVDIAQGRLVSASREGVRRIEAFGGSPIAAAEAFVRAGARWLHVVDVDRAEGRPADLDLLHRIAGLGAGVQASGGITSEGGARDALEAGAARVVLSSAMLADGELIADAVRHLSQRAVVGIEAEGVRIRPRSADANDLPLPETLEWVRDLGAVRYLYTGVARVGGLSGPDVEGIEAAAAILRRPVLAAGGIRDLEDVMALRDLGSDVVDGIVVGRALYEGLDLPRAIAAVG
jgi:phosphoribosylformimino-5-aminoimidazole carboxamide ribonucleotide (ProFAR) isomerase